MPVLSASAKRMPSLLLLISWLSVMRLLSAAPVIEIAPTAPVTDSLLFVR